MTAINTVLKRDSVHLLTDAASYDIAGNLVTAAPKVALLPHLNAAVACRGPHIALPLIADLLGAAASTYDDLKAKAPAFICALLPIFEASFAQCQFGSDFDIVVAGISEMAGPDAYLICSHDRYGAAPFSTVQLSGLSLLPGDPAIHERVLATVLSDVEQFDVERDGLAVLEAQRAHAVEHAGGRWLTGVGGFAQVTSITRDGISTRVIHRWADEVGQPIGAADILAAAQMLRVAA